MTNDPLLSTWKLGSHHVPGIWRFMLPNDLRDLELPSERRSTCGSCPKVIAEGFDRAYKCCTYHPRVPNFLLGLGLSIPESRPFIIEHIDGGFVVPEGATSTPRQWLDAVLIGAESSYGRTETVRCQFLDQQLGRCGIYPVRNSVCSSFFCLNDHGQTGTEFWDRLQEMVSQVEAALAQWCLEEIGFDMHTLIGIYERHSEAIDQVSDAHTKAWRTEIRQELFGEWYGREVDLFWRCADLVRKNREDLYSIAQQVKILEPSKFEKALVNQVPQSASSAIDPSYMVEGGEPARIDDMWYVTKLAHRQLWQIPSGMGMIRLNPEAMVTAKDPAEPMSLFYTEFPMIVTLSEFDGDKEFQWRQYLSEQEARALQWFETPRHVNEWLDSPVFEQWERPQQFIAEWLRKNILQWIVKH